MSKTHYAEIERANESFNQDYWEVTLCGLREHEVDVDDKIKYVNCKTCLKIYEKKMNTKHRKKIVREANKRCKLNHADFDNLGEGEKIGIQDKYLDEVCKEKGFRPNEFWNEENKELEKILHF